MYRDDHINDEYNEHQRVLRSYKEERMRDDRYENGRGDGRQTSEPYYSLVLNGLDSRIPLHVLKDEIYQHFHRYGSCSIKIVDNNNTRIAFVNYTDPECARAAKYAKKNLVLFERDVRVDPVYPKYARSPNGYGREYYPNKSNRYETRDDFSGYSERDKYYQQYGSSYISAMEKEHKFPYHLHHVSPEADPMATRTLFVGNIDVNIREEDLYGIFERYGTIEEIDIKRPPQPGKGNAYAFIKYYNVDMAHRAKCDMSGRYIGTYQCKIGYGKPTLTNCLWVGGLGQWVKPDELETEFDRFGVIERIEWPQGKSYAYVLFGSVDAATAACKEMRGFALGGHKIRVDYAEEGHMPSKSRADSERKPSYGLAEIESKREREQLPRRDSHGRYSNYEKSESHRSVRNEGDRHSDGHERRTRKSSVADDKSQRSEKDPAEGDGASRSKRMRTKSPSAGGSFKNCGGRTRTSESEGREFKEGDKDASLSKDKVDFNSVNNVADMSKDLPVVWGGALVLKNSSFATCMHLVSGNVHLVDTLMRDPTSTEMATLKITQRLRLDQPKLEEVGRRVSTSGDDGFAVLLAMCRPDENVEENGTEQNVQQRPLRNLISYLKQKEAAGVISLPPNPSKDKKNIGVLHAFPPCSFGYDYLTKRAPKLQCDTIKDDHLVIIVVRGAA